MNAFLKSSFERASTTSLIFFGPLLGSTTRSAPFSPNKHEHQHQPTRTGTNKQTNKKESKNAYIYIRTSPKRRKPPPTTGLTSELSNVTNQRSDSAGSRDLGQQSQCSILAVCGEETPGFGADGGRPCRLRMDSSCCSTEGGRSGFMAPAPQNYTTAK